jgi:hypothetical protein
MTDNREHLIDLATYLKDLVGYADKEAPVLLLTCMDFRFFVMIAKIMEVVGLAGKYDHVILAGAALGAVVLQEPAEPAWHQTFFDHVELAKELHKIKYVLVMEHRDCGAYGPEGFNLLVPPFSEETERRVHGEQVDKLQEKIFPGLGFGALLLNKPTKTDALTCDQLI